MSFLFSSLRERCLATIAYFDLFDYPLTLEEVHRFFLGEQPLLPELKSFLENEQLVSRQDGYFFLKGRDLITVTREQREAVSAKYWKKVRVYLPFIQFVPFVRMVGVCNTLSYNNASAESDIDLFIVAQKGRLFFVRFLTVLLFSLLGVRRHGTRIAGRFCLSFYVDESALNLQAIQSGDHDIYLPFWILTMRPVYGRPSYEKFIRENFWVSKYFGRPLSLVQDFWRPNFLRLLAILKEKIWGGSWGDALEKKFREHQMKRHLRKKDFFPAESSIVVDEHMLKFHNIDRRKDVAQRFEQRLQELGIV